MTLTASHTPQLGANSAYAIYVIRNRSVPTDTQLAHIYYENLAAASRWLQNVFGFAELYRYGEPLSGVQMQLGDAHFMLSGVRAGRASPLRVAHQTQSVTVFIEDVAAHFAKVKLEGAKIVEDLNETCYGELQYAAEDIEGHFWLFSQHVRDVNPEDWGATLAK